jgi:hypothetical protein
MDTQELIVEIRKLSPDEQRKLLDALSTRASQGPKQDESISENEIDKMLFEKGIIGNIPDLSNYTDTDEDFDPIEVTGKPLSETIVEDRR